MTIEDHYGDHFMPEHRLLWAILQRTYLDLNYQGFQFQGEEKRGYLVLKHHRREALQWVISDTMDQWGFVWICDILDLNIENVRLAMLKGRYLV